MGGTVENQSEPQAPIRVILADDHALVRAGLRSLMATLPDVEIVDEACNGREAVQLVCEREPDVVMMDISMPELNGLEATSRIRQERPRTRVMMVSMHAAPEYVLQALQAGATSFFVKDSTADELATAIRTTAKGETYLSPQVSRHVIEDYVRISGGTPAVKPLTPRQREVLQLIAEGNTSKEIAKKLGLALKTVETHRTLLMKHLNIHDLAGLVRYAIRVGLATADR